jgi:hypothetical protein
MKSEEGNLWLWDPKHWKVNFIEESGCSGFAVNFKTTIRNPSSQLDILAKSINLQIISIYMLLKCKKLLRTPGKWREELWLIPGSADVNILKNEK